MGRLMDKLTYLGYANRVKEDKKDEDSNNDDVVVEVESNIKESDEVVEVLEERPNSIVDDGPAYR